MAVKIAVVLLILLFSGTVILNFVYFRYGNEDSFDTIIYNIAQKHNVDPLLIKAIIKRESRFKYRSIGSKGEIGLMQLMPGAIKDWERVHKQHSLQPNEIFKPAQNIEIGTWYFAQAQRHWGHSKNKNAFALAQYNAGRGNMLKWIKKHGELTDYESLVQFPSTRKYIDVILGYYQDYREKEEEKNGPNN